MFAKWNLVVLVKLLEKISHTNNSESQETVYWTSRDLTKFTFFCTQLTALDCTWLPTFTESEPQLSINPGAKAECLVMKQEHMQHFCGKLNLPFVKNHVLFPSHPSCPPLSHSTHLACFHCLCELIWCSAEDILMPIVWAWLFLFMLDCPKVPFNCWTGMLMWHSPACFMAIWETDISQVVS
jgi:hypothetical protein